MLDGSGGPGTHTFTTNADLDWPVRQPRAAPAGARIVKVSLAIFRQAGTRGVLGGIETANLEHWKVMVQNRVSAVAPGRPAAGADHAQADAVTVSPPFEPQAVAGPLDRERRTPQFGEAERRSELVACQAVRRQPRQSQAADAARRRTRIDPHVL